MSDEEDIDLPKLKKQKIHFGSLEEAERERLANVSSEKNKVKVEEEESNDEEDEEQENEEGDLPAAIMAGIKAGNINISDGESDVLFDHVIFVV